MTVKGEDVREYSRRKHVKELLKGKDILRSTSRKRYFTVTPGEDMLRSCCKKTCYRNVVRRQVTEILQGEEML